MLTDEKLARLVSLYELPISVVHIENPAATERFGCVYFLFRGDALVYIGETAGLSRRIKNHKDRKRKKFDRVLILPLHRSPPDERRAIERALIRRLRPEYNIRHSRRRASTRHLKRFLSPWYPRSERAWQQLEADADSLDISPSEWLLDIREAEVALDRALDADDEPNDQSDTSALADDDSLLATITATMPDTSPWPAWIR